MGGGGTILDEFPLIRPIKTGFQQGASGSSGLKEKIEEEFRERNEDHEEIEEFREGNKDYVETEEFRERNEDQEECTTPKSEIYMIKPLLICPPAPRKPKPVKRKPNPECFFIPRDLDLVFLSLSSHTKKLKAV
ncbi:hypothetical protein AMTRI_Chr12g241730 [Amborella trichopoda]